jgi:hypothetical protein
MQMLTRARTLATLGLTLVLAGACGGGDGTGPGGGDNLEAAYSLQRVNHVDVPAEAEMNWGTAGFRSGSLQLAGDGTWQMEIRYDNIDSGERLTLDDNGDYHRDGGTLHLSSDHFGDEFDGAVDGDKITIKYDFDGDGGYESDFTFSR